MSDASREGNDLGTRIMGCRTTRIYCLPTCRYTPRVLPRNRVAFGSIDEARLAGYRPCKVCRPDSVATHRS